MYRAFGIATVKPPTRPKVNPRRHNFSAYLKNTEYKVPNRFLAYLKGNRVNNDPMTNRVRNLGTIYNPGRKAFYIDGHGFCTWPQRKFIVPAGKAVIFFGQSYYCTKCT
jgi:hypothetical protein